MMGALLLAAISRVSVSSVLNSSFDAVESIYDELFFHLTCFWGN